MHDKASDGFDFLTATHLIYPSTRVRFLSIRSNDGSYLAIRHHELSAS